MRRHTPSRVRHGIDERTTVLMTPADIERRFRRRTRHQDRRLTSMLVRLVALAVVCFATLDVVFYSDGLSNGAVLVCRAVAIGSSAIAALVLRRVSSARALDWTVAIWLVLFMAAQFGVGMLRPAGWSPVPVINMLFILGSYTLLPVPLRYQAVPAVAFSVANIVLVIVGHGGGPVRVQIASVAAYLLANVFGLLISGRHQHLRRRHYQALDREREARRRLRTALDEVKVLRGIIPICAVCKKVRNDDGLYEAVEAYLTRCSGADFSHTICPDCFSEHYPDEFASIRGT